MASARVFLVIPFAPKCGVLVVGTPVAKAFWLGCIGFYIAMGVLTIPQQAKLEVQKG